MKLKYVSSCNTICSFQKRSTNKKQSESERLLTKVEDKVSKISLPILLKVIYLAVLK